MRPPYRTSTRPSISISISSKYEIYLCGYYVLWVTLYRFVSTNRTEAPSPYSYDDWQQLLNARCRPYCACLDEQPVDFKSLRWYFPLSVSYLISICHCLLWTYSGFHIGWSQYFDVVKEEPRFLAYVRNGFRTLPMTRFYSYHMPGTQRLNTRSSLATNVISEVSLAVVLPKAQWPGYSVAQLFLTTHRNRSMMSSAGRRVCYSSSMHIPLLTKRAWYPWLYVAIVKQVDILDAVLGYYIRGHVVAFSPYQYCWFGGSSLSLEVTDVGALRARKPGRVPPASFSRQR